MEQNGLYAAEYDENGYMEQEEEWEREGLLDPAWEKQQKKVSQWKCRRSQLSNLWISRRCEKRLLFANWLIQT